MKITLAGIKEANLDKKNGHNSFLVKHLRPLANLVTYLLLKLNIKPITVTYSYFLLVFIAFFISLSLTKIK